MHQSFKFLVVIIGICAAVITLVFYFDLWFIIAIGAGFFAIAHLLDFFIWSPKRRREAEAAPRITLCEVNQFWESIERDALPMAKAHVQARAPTHPQESRIGGQPLAICNGAAWPWSGDFPMAFVAQINFSEMTALDEFPKQGILQIFTSFEYEGDGSHIRVIRWEPNPSTEDLLEIPKEVRKTTRQTRDISERARCVGLPLEFARHFAPANPYNWPYDERDPIYENRLAGSDDVQRILDGWEDRSEAIRASYGDHWVGGHPSFVQTDIRHDPDLQYLDRVLFHLGCDDDINLGDSGELNVLIAIDDLVARNFEKAYLTWDCS